jgi:glycolate oxidase iron-sulfur subunit
MQTSFSLAQLADPAVAEADKILRACVHCGFCTATCPTYVLLGDELDSPRGRIYLIKDMLENDRPAGPEEVKHIDRCLSCLSCMTTCPSGVHYMHLVDHARAYVEKTYVRPPLDRLLRALIARVIPDRRLFRLAMLAALLGKPLASLFAAMGLKPLAAMLRLAPVRMPARVTTGRRVHAAAGTRRGRVALLKGCVAPVMAPAINAAAIRVLNRFGIEVVEVGGEGCCGALVHHMGRERESVDAARANIDAWMREMASEGIDAIVTTVSGCGTMLKDYGFMLRHDRVYAEKAAAVALLVRDISEYITQLEVEPTPMRRAATPRDAALAPIVVAYHAACSLQHGQKIVREPKELLCKFGFVVKDAPEGHLCCGSAGTYNMLQPELAGRLRDRKVANIASVAPDVIAAGNIGCITQIAGGTAIPVVHPVELIDWATGGPVPGAMTAEVKPRPA